MPRSGGYILGFRIDPLSKLEEVYREITSFHLVYIKSPNFGVNMDIDISKKNEITIAATKSDQEADVVLNDDTSVDVLANYLVSSKKDKDKHPVYNSELGLAVEELPEGITVKSLWNIVS